MDITTWVAIVFVFIVDVILIIRDRKIKVIFAGSNKYRILKPVIIILLIAGSFISRNIRIEDIIVIVGVLPLVFVGNKSGITENGLLSNSYVIAWDKIINYSLEEQGDKYIIIYKSNMGTRKIFFKLEDKEEIKKYMQGKRKLKYIRK